MLESNRIQSRQSEIRQKLAAFQVAGELTSAQQTEVRSLSTEYQSNEAKFQAALVTEDEQRQKANAELETRGGDTWGKLVSGFELRQVVAALDTGAALSGQTAEAVTELRSKGGYRGLPVPFEALEQRADTTSANLSNPVTVRPLMERLFPASVAGAMGAQMIAIPAGSAEWPITTDGASVAWAASEGGNVASSSAYKTMGRSVSPDHTLGVQMKLTRKAVAQTAGIEGAIRRDMQAEIQKELDRAIFLGSGATGEPNGIIAKAAAYGIAVNATATAASWAALQAEVIAFMQANTAAGPGAVKALMRPEVWAYMDGKAFLSNTAGITEWSVLQSRLGAITLTSNALAAPVTDQSTVLLTTGQPIFFATWGAIDLIRDPYSDAQSGGLRVTALVTCDVTAGRAEQLRVLSKVKSAD